MTISLKIWREKKILPRKTIIKVDNRRHNHSSKTSQYMYVHRQLLKLITADTITSAKHHDVHSSRSMNRHETFPDFKNRTSITGPILKVLQKAGTEIYSFLVKYKSFENLKFWKLHCFRNFYETFVSCL